MHGLLARQASEANVIAIGACTTGARHFATGKPIKLITGAGLPEMARSVQTDPAYRALCPQASAAPG